MKKRIVALLLGGVLAAGSLAMRTPVTAWAAEEVSENPDTSDDGSGDPEDTTPSGNEDLDMECDWRSEPHIKDFEIKAGDGQITVTFDAECENKNTGELSAPAEVNVLLIDKKLVASERETVKYSEIYEELETELVQDGKPKYEYLSGADTSRAKRLHGESSCTFTSIVNGKTYHIYVDVFDRHGIPGSEDDIGLHDPVYLGPATPGSDPGSGSGGSGSSKNNSSGSGSVTPPRDQAKESEERVIGQIQAAPAGSTVVMDKSITTLSNNAMKELQKRDDVSLKLDFTYMGQRYIITIPAGAALDDDIPWYGPLYLAQQFGNSAAANEVDARGTEQELIAQIKETPAGYTIVMGKGVTTLSRSVIKELQKKGDISLRLDLTYENKRYVITIPAGAALDDDIPWYGPLYLIQHFGNSAEFAD